MRIPTPYGYAQNGRPNRSESLTSTPAKTVATRPFSWLPLRESHCKLERSPNAGGSASRNGCRRAPASC